LPTRSGVSEPLATLQGTTVDPAQGWRRPWRAPPPGGLGQPNFICAMRRWLPKGSRSPKSMPYGWSTGSSVISTPFALSSAWVL
jgi:hypothetical protein